MDIRIDCKSSLVNPLASIVFNNFSKRLQSESTPKRCESEKSCFRSLQKLFLPPLRHRSQFVCIIQRQHRCVCKCILVVIHNLIYPRQEVLETMSSKKIAKALIGGNWKCNGTVASVRQMAEVLNKAGPLSANSEVVIAAPSLHLSTLKSILRPDIAVSAEVREIPKILTHFYKCTATCHQPLDHACKSQ
ncbi:hypothetical protein EON64_13080 [archaeon]|nr:MAG: hypothetical protein EON64_13080 [archaeon]